MRSGARRRGHGMLLASGRRPMTQPQVQEQETAQGYTPEELEVLLVGVDAAIAAGLTAVAAFIVAQMVLPGAPKTGPGTPFISMDALNLTSSIWAEELDERIMPLLAEMFDGSAERVAEDLEDLGIPNLPPIEDVTAADILGQARNRLVAIGDDLWVNMRTSLTEGMRLGESIPELAERVRAAAPVTVPRSHVIARTEAIGATNQASIVQARSAGVALEKGWEATDDTRTRLAHREADGQWVPLDGMFEVGGELLDIPGDPRGSAANVIQCRCAVLFRLAVTTAGFRPQFHTCMGQDGLPPHKGPCRGSRSARKPAAPKAVPKVRKVPVPARARPFHHSVEGRENLVAIAAAARRKNSGAERSRLYGGISSDTELVQLPDGRTAVHKGPFFWQDADDAKRSADAEQLGSALGEALGVSVPRVFRDEETAVWMDYLPGVVPVEDRKAAFKTDMGARVGLLDVLGQNVDRNDSNLLERDGELFAIDHGEMWHYPTGKKAGEEAFDPMELVASSDVPGSLFAKNRPNPLHPDDVDVIKRRVERLRPDFEKLGRVEWLDYSLKALEEIRPSASGTVRLYE